MSEPSSAAVELADVGVWRRVDGGRRDLLRAIHWRVEHGEHWGILGPNGAGKTTLLKVVSAQMRPSSGAATILGGRLGATSMPELRRMIGFVEPSLGRRFYPDQTVFEVVVSGARGAILLAEPATADELSHAHELLGVVGETALAGQPFVTCSEGERARILLARALMAEARLLILDEPAAGLDLPGRELLLATLVDIARARPGLTTLTVSHHIEELPPTTTHLLLLRAAEVVAAGPVDEVATDELLSACFGLALTAVRSGGRISVRTAAS